LDRTLPYRTWLRIGALFFLGPTPGHRLHAFRDPRFEDLQNGAIRFDVFGVEILASDLPDIIRSKEAADRPQDRQDVIVLREILRRRNARD
jgi:hypothetical protein